MTFRDYTQSGGTNTSKQNITFRDYTTKNKKQESLDDTTNEENKLLEQIKNNATSSNKKAESLLGTLVGTSTQVGKGILDFGESISDLLLSMGSSKWNPFMHLLYNGDVSDGQEIANELIKADASEEALKVLGYTPEIQQQINDMSYVKDTNAGGTIARSIGNQLPSMFIGSSITGLSPGVGTGINTLQKAQEIGSLGTMGMSAFGSGIETALNNGATRNEANAYGLLSAATEIGTELMFAGVGNVIGTGPIDDAIVNKLTKNMKNSLMKSMVKFGVSNIGEGIEELASDLIQPFIQKLTYSDESLVKLFEDQNFAEDFWMGVLSSTVMSGIATPFKNKTNIQIDDIENMTPEQIVEEVRKQESKSTKTESQQENTINEIESKINETPLVQGEQEGSSLTGKDVSLITPEIIDIDDISNDIKATEKQQKATENNTVKDNLSSTVDKSAKKLPEKAIINEKNNVSFNEGKNEFLKQLSKKGIKSQETKIVNEQTLSNRKQMFELTAKNFAKQESILRTDTQKLNTWANNVIKNYDSYINDGGTPISEFEKFRKKYNLYTPQQAKIEETKSTKDISKINQSLTSNNTYESNLNTIRRAVNDYQSKINKGMERIPQYDKWFNEIKIHDSATSNMNTEINNTTKATRTNIENASKKINTESTFDNAVIDENLKINDFSELDNIIDELDTDNNLTTEKIISTINSKYNEQGLKETKREALNKGKIMPKGTDTIQQFIDQYYSFRWIDKQNQTTNIVDYINQKARVDSLLNQAINGSNFLTVDFEVTDIPSLKTIWDRIPVNMRDVAFNQMLLEMDYKAKLNQDQYGISTVDSRAHGYNTSELKSMIDETYSTYPELKTLIHEYILPDIQRINYSLNKQRIKYKTLNEFTYVTPEFAKNEMKMTNSDIQSVKTSKGVKVNTADYFKAYNPYYIPISRETSNVYEGNGSFVESRVSKPKGLQKGAYAHNIQNLDDGMCEKLSMEYRKMLDNKVRTAIATEWGNLTNQKTIVYEKLDGTLGGITTNSEGNVTMPYLDTNSKGDLVTKSIQITNEMKNAYNGLGSSISNFKQTKLGKALSVKSAIQRGLATKFNIPWQIANTFMDGFDAFVNNEFGLKGNAEYIKNEAGAFIKDFLNNEPVCQEFLGFQGEHLTEIMKKGYIDKSTGLEAVKNKVSRLLEISELITRYAIYKTARTNGYSIQEAQRMTREGTTDFGKTGLVWKELDAKGFTVFTGPAIAGMNRAIDTLVMPTVNSLSIIGKQLKQGGTQQVLNKNSYTEFDKKTLKKSATQLIKLSLLGVSRELLKRLWDDEDKQKAIANLSDTEIQNNIIIPIDDNSVIKIPKGRIQRTYDALVDLFTNSSINDQDKMNIGETLLYTVESVGVSSIDSSTTFSNAMNILKNEDYYGNQIYENDVISKDTLDYLVKQYGNYLYKTIQYINGGTELNPWVSRFYTDTTTVTSYNTRYYNMKDTYSTLYDKTTGGFNSAQDMNNYFAYKVIDYEKSNGELGVELAKLKALKNDSTSTTDNIRQQEEKVKAIYKELYSYIDNNTATDFSIKGDNSVIRIGSNYRYTKVKNDDGTYSYRKTKK